MIKELQLPELFAQLNEQATPFKKRFPLETV